MAALFVEVVALFLVGGACYAATELLSFKKLDKSIGMQETKSLLIVIPLAAYIAYRLYFGAIQYLTSKIDQRYSIISM